MYPIRPRSETLILSPGCKGEGVKSRNAGSELRTMLGIDGQSVHGVERFPHGFVKRRMRVDGVHQCLDGRLSFHREHTFANELERFRSYDVDAQDLAVGFIRDNFDEPIVPAQ